MSKNKDLQQAMEADKKRSEAAKGLLSVRSHLNRLKTIKKRSQLTSKDLTEVPEETVAYKAVGRMFLITTMPEVKQELQNILKQTDDDTAMFEKKEKLLIREHSDADKAFKEIMESARAKQKG